MPILFLLMLATPTVGENASADDLRKDIRALVEAELSEHPAPGLAITLIVDGEVAWFEGLGFADKRAETPVTVDTIFSVCSISKSVAAWEFMRLVERDALSLDAPVVPLIEDLWEPRKRVEETDGITLRRLLSHTAGLSVHGVGGVPVGRNRASTKSTVLGRALGSRRVDLVQSPGEGYRYSGGGFGVAQLLFETTTGRDFAEAIQEDVILPLGMTSSGFHWTPDRIARSATPYMPSGRVTKRLDYSLTAAAGFITSSRDFARFAIACMPYHRSQEAEDVLATETLLQMIEPTPASPYYGIGVARKPIQRLLTFGHTGGDHGWTSVLRIAPQKGDALIILQNCYEAEPLSRKVEDVWARWVVRTRR
jgi:CubicO group peptidase (beta-lactamase class C family)